MKLFLFGSPILQSPKGQPLDFDTRKAMAILAYLSLNEESFRRDTLAAMFWPELDQSRSRAALRRTLTPINKILGNAALITTRDTVKLNPKFQLWVDVCEFSALVGESIEHSHKHGEDCQACFERITSAASLYKGDFMAGFTLRDAPDFDNWQFFETERYHRMYASALEILIPLLAGRRMFDQAIDHARAWLALDPLHEPAHRALMRLFAQSNQRTAALRQYRECVRILDEELGVSPLEETKRLYEDILENRISLDSQSDLAPGTPSPEPEIIAVPKSQLEKIPTQTTSLASFDANFQYPLIGRVKEMQAMLEAYSRPGPDGYLIGIEGEAGIGKTRLVEEFLLQAQARGAITMTTRCYRGEEQLAYGPFVEGVRSILGRPDNATRLAGIPDGYLVEAARLLPELGSYNPSVPDDSGSITTTQTRMFESMRQIIYVLTSGISPGVLVVDDLQWADTASLDLLIYMIRRLRDYPIFIIAAWRSEGDLDRFAGLMAEVSRTGLGSKIVLDRLTQDDVIELAETVDELSLEHFQSLYSETEGLPFFVVEYLSAARQQKNWDTLRSVKDLERARLIGLDEAARQILGTASVIGRSFEYDTLREASGRSEEETVTGLEQLVSRGLLVERSVEEVGLVNDPAQSKNQRASFAPKYDFTHEKIRAVVYEDTSLARRRLLHRRVADAILKNSRTADLDAFAARIAYHFERAGQDSEAATYYQLAGEYARKLYANNESLAHFQTALALGHSDPAGIHEAIGDLQTLIGEYNAAFVSLETAAALASADHLVWVEHKIANLHHRRGDYELATSFFRTALDSAGEASEGFRAQVLADWSRTCVRLDDLESAQRLAEEALETSRAGDDPIPAGQAHNVLGMIARQRGNPSLALEHLEQALEIAKGENHLPAQIAALNNLALVYEDEKDYSRAVELAQSALDLCARLGDRHREAALRNRLADLFHASEQPSAAMYHLKKAVEIFAEIGEKAGDYEPEIWKLTEW